MQGTKTLPKIDDQITEADGKAHRVRVKALMHGGPVTALCGKRWVPSTAGADVLDRERCGTCEELWQMLGSMYG